MRHNYEKLPRPLVLRCKATSAGLGYLEVHVGLGYHSIIPPGQYGSYHAYLGTMTLTFLTKLEPPMPEMDVKWDSKTHL